MKSLSPSEGVACRGRSYEDTHISPQAYEVLTKKGRYPRTHI